MEGRSDKLHASHEEGLKSVVSIDVVVLGQLCRGNDGRAHLSVVTREGYLVLF